MSDEERSQAKKPEFRVVDKRISARGDSPAAAPPPEPPADVVEPEPAPTQSAPDPPAEGAGPSTGEQQHPSPPGPQEGVWTPEQEAEARAFVEEIAQRPSLEWVVNTAVTLANVAGTKLDLGQTTDAQLAIDALAAIVEKLGSRLQQTEAPLKQTLAQLQLAYAQRAMQPPPTTP